MKIKQGLILILVQVPLHSRSTAKNVKYSRYYFAMLARGTQYQVCPYQYYKLYHNNLHNYLYTIILSGGRFGLVLAHPSIATRLPGMWEMIAGICRKVVLLSWAWFVVSIIFVPLASTQSSYSTQGSWCVCVSNVYIRCVLNRFVNAVSCHQYLQIYKSIAVLNCYSI